MRNVSLFVLVAILISIPAFGQTTDFAGEWANRNHEDATDRIGGPPIGDYLGFALNDAGRLRAQSWDGAEWSLPEFQCRPHLAPYDWRAAGDLQIMKEIDPVSRELVAYHVRRIRTQDRTIFLDGRPHPPDNATHTWEGFSTAKFDGNTLVVTNSHVKEGYMRRNGVAFSEKVKSTEYIMRHGDYLTVVGFIDDPVYLEEPWIFSVNYQLNIHTQLTYFPCTVIEDENITRVVPHHLPGKNPYLTEWLAKDGVPAEAAEGRRETLYPEYQLKMKKQQPSN